MIITRYLNKIFLNKIKNKKSTTKKLHKKYAKDSENDFNLSEEFIWYERYIKKIELVTNIKKTILFW
jgi:hypothetical protein